MTEFIQSLSNTVPLYAYAIVFAIMLVNGAINTPSSQILYIFVGYLTTQGHLSVLFLVLAGALGNTLGNVVTYEIVRKTGSKYSELLFPMNDARRNALARFSKQNGFWYILYAKLVPAVKVIVPLAAGFSALSRTKVYGAFALSSLLWATLFISIGVLFGVQSQFALLYGIGTILLIVILMLYAYKKYPQLFSGTDTLAK
jgi:membrane protein DedA with SNARE-associated domain